MGTSNTWVLWLKQISETSSFHSFWFKFKGMNHLKIETHLIPVRENPPKHPWKLGILAILLVFFFWMVNKKTLILSKVKLSDLFKPSWGFFQGHSHHESTPRKLETPIPRVFSEWKKNSAVTRVDPSTPTFDVFWEGFARLLLAVFGGALSYGPRGALDGAPSAAARLRQWPGWVASCGDGEGLKEPATPQKSLKDPAWG